MRKPLLYYTVDVFSEKSLAGNPLAIFLDSEGLTDREMLEVAKEMNYSESMFIQSLKPKPDGGYPVRIFTPNRELPFAGHPVLGTAYVLKHLLNLSDAIQLNLISGPVRVMEEQEILWMQHHPPEFLSELDPRWVGHTLNLSPDDFDLDYPIAEVSTGLSSLIIPLQKGDLISRFSLNHKEYQQLVSMVSARSVLVFSASVVDKEHDLHVRVFVDALGVSEDPATGSANGSLLAYLLKYLPDKRHLFLKIEQGYEMARPSVLYLRGDLHGDEYDIWVGGKVVPVSQGVLHLSPEHFWQRG